MTLAFNDGVLYGTTFGGRPFDGSVSNRGTVFRLSPPTTSGGSWTETSLHSFTGGTDGSNPFGGLAFGDSGTIYGTTAYGGAGKGCEAPLGCGTVFQLTPAGTRGPWTESVLYSFAGAADGNHPTSLVINDGALQGATQRSGSPGHPGTLFELTPPAVAGGAWTRTTLHVFDGKDGGSPQGLLLKDGLLFGACLSGGIRFGTIFQLTL